MKANSHGASVRSLRDESGGALIETALVLPTFCLFIFGLFNFSIILFGYCNATFAARVGARAASMNSSTSLAPSSSTSIQTLVTPFLFAAPSTGTTVSTAWTPANTVGSTVTVTVKIVYPVNIPLFPLTQITVGSSSERTVIR